MTLVKLENAARQFRTEPIWQNLSLSIEPGERLGIIGSNGCGKSTLMRVIAGIDKPDYGSISFAKDLTVGWLAQTPEFNPEHSIRQAVEHTQSAVLETIKEYEKACEIYSRTSDPADAARMDALNRRLSASDAWSLNVRMENLLSTLELNNIDKPMGLLSQGTRKKVAICAALLENPQLLMLDEPTNHLDAASIDWLALQLNNFKGAIVVVTHDRYFLDSTAERILELEHGTGKLYEGSYEKYLVQKEHDLALSHAEAEKRANLIRREMAWFKRGARARSTKQKARQERLAEIIELQKQQTGLLSKASETNFGSLAGSQRLGSKGINLYDISKSYQNHILFKDFSLKIGKGERIGIVGPNGCGKSTLLRIINETEAPDSGHIETGETVRIGTYSQTGDDDAPGSLSIIDYVRESGEYIIAPDGRRVSAENLLEQFLFPRSIQHNQAAKLSGGEFKRLRLLRLLMRGTNCLILDEPTNDLDIPTLIRLEAWLDDFPGIVIIVSHDRYFLDRCADRLFCFDGHGQIREFIGDYASLREAMLQAAKHTSRQMASPRTSAAAASASPSPAPKKKKLTFKQQTRLRELESLIEQQENRRGELQKLLENPSGDSAQMDKDCREFEKLSQSLDSLMQEWEELAALA